MSTFTAPDSAERPTITGTVLATQLDTAMRAGVYDKGLDTSLQDVGMAASAEMKQWKECETKANADPADTGAIRACLQECGKARLGTFWETQKLLEPLMTITPFDDTEGSEPTALPDPHGSRVVSDEKTAAAIATAKTAEDRGDITGWFDAHWSRGRTDRTLPDDRTISQAYETLQSAFSRGLLSEQEVHREVTHLRAETRSVRALANHLKHVSATIDKHSKQVRRGLRGKALARMSLLEATEDAAGASTAGSAAEESTSYASDQGSGVTGTNPKTCKIIRMTDAELGASVKRLSKMLLRAHLLGGFGLRRYTAGATQSGDASEPLESLSF